MPYPESCPECGGVFRNTGTHFTARRNEVGRHVLLELGCQATSRRFWWDFTSGSLTDDGQATSRHVIASHVVDLVSAANGSDHAERNGHAATATLDEPIVLLDLDTSEPPIAPPLPPVPPTPPMPETNTEIDPSPTTPSEMLEAMAAEPMNLPCPPPDSLKDAFVRQLQLDRLTLRQMRSWLMSDEARRAIEVAAGATEATYERLALILFGTELPQLLGKQMPVQLSTVMSAEERLELQREKARIRARLRRAAAKAARQPSA